MIANNTVTIIGTAATLCFLLPFITLIAVKKNTHASLRPCIYGVLVFILFSRILESLLHMICLGMNTPFSSFLANNPWAYALYAALAAGLFEETGRLFAFHMIKKDTTDKTSALMYGIGHGGIESILIGAFSLLNLMIVALSINATGIDAFYAEMGDLAPTMEATVDSLINSPAYLYFISVWERIVSLGLQVALSVLVFYSVKDRSKRYLFPLAILLHALVDIFAALYQTEVITNLFVLEAIVTVYTLVVGYFSSRLYKADKE